MQIKHHHIPLFFILLIVFLSFSGCDLINPEEEIPAYLYIEPFVLETNPAVQGTASHRITEAWLTIDGEFLGAYSLPALAPVLKEGEHTIILHAGIKDNGILATPEIYPFFDPYQTTLTIRPGQTDTLFPRIRYQDNIRFSIIEDFESGTPLFQEIRSGSSFNRLRVVEDIVFEGKGSGRIALNEAFPEVVLATSRRFRDLTENGLLVYLEVNYRSDVPVVFGAIGHKQGLPGEGTERFEAGFNPREDWNKIYFNLSPLFQDRTFDEYQIGMKAFIPRENGILVRNEANVWLDNIKLVHF